MKPGVALRHSILVMDRSNNRLQLRPDADHIFYIMARCRGLAGDGVGAYENLKRAIDLEPRNRAAARQDADFAALAARYPEIHDLLALERSVSGRM